MPEGDIEKEKDEFTALTQIMWTDSGYNLIDLMDADILMELLDRIQELSHDLQVCRVKRYDEQFDFKLMTLSQQFHQLIIDYCLYGTKRIGKASEK